MRWIVAADHAQAKIFEQEADGANLQASKIIEHAAGRARNQDLKEGRAGRAFESSPQSHHSHAMNTQHSPREHEEEEFAKLIVSVLERGRVSRLFDDLILAAEPGLLGEIVRHMNRPLKEMMLTTMPKDVLHLSAPALNELFKAKNLSSTNPAFDRRGSF